MMETPLTENAVYKSVEAMREASFALIVAVEALDRIIHPDGGLNVRFYDEVRRFEMSLIERALKYESGSLTKAARLLGLHKSTLHHKIKLYGISLNGESGISATG
jgi:DNA-binding protein Fis